MLQTLFSLLCVQYIFFWFYQNVQFEAKNMLERSRITSSVGLYMENATDIIFSIVCEKYIFGLIEALDSKAILKRLKKGITSAMECTDLAAFTFAT